MIDIRFFTDKTIDNPWLLIKIKDYIKLRDKGEDFSKWKEVYVDPGVYDLTKGPTYSWEGKIDIMEFVGSLPENHYFSWDYPGDMNEDYTDLFLKKSWDNAVDLHSYPQYLVTVQYKFNNYFSFIKWFNRYNDLPIESGILGIGNYCRYMYLDEFVKHSLPYVFKNCKHPRIHIYGLALRIIPYAFKLAKKYGIKLSIDSTKWTRCVSQELKDRVGKVNCSTATRQEFFDEYMKVIQKRGIELEY